MQLRDKESLHMIKSAKILIVEDDKDFRSNLAEYLLSIGYSVTALETLTEFKNTIIKISFDIALIDVNLPDGSGHQISRYLRDTSPTRIIMLTARGSEADRLESYAAGADLHLLKPVAVKELRAVIETLILRLSESISPNKLNNATSCEAVSGGWILRAVPPELVAPSGKSIELSIKDYLLIQHILSHPEEYIDAEYLLNKTKFTERLTNEIQLNERISNLSQVIEKSLGIKSPISYVADKGFVFYQSKI